MALNPVNVLKGVTAGLSAPPRKGCYYLVKAEDGKTDGCLSMGFVFCITIIGIPFGPQHFKLSGYSLFPFGRTIS